MTKVVELASNSPNILCQNVTTLVIGNIYQLNFSIYNHLTMFISEIGVLINSQPAFNHTTVGENTFSNASYIMTAKTTDTQICFNYSLAPTWNVPSVGPCLDNVTLESYVPIFNPAGRSTLLCNGDFEAYAFPVGSDFVGVLPNYSCWYDRGGGVLEIQNKLNPDTTKVADLAYYYPYVLCQNVSLAIGSMYWLNFTVFNPQNMTTSEIHVLLNSQIIFNHTTLNQRTFSNASYIVVAQSTNTQICFDYSLSPSWNSPSTGPCLDNITLEAYFPIFTPRRFSATGLRSICYPSWVRVCRRTFKLLLLVRQKWRIARSPKETKSKHY